MLEAKRQSASERASEREGEKVSSETVIARGQVYGPMGPHGSLVPTVIPACRELRNSMDHLAVTPWEMQPHGSIMRITLLRTSRRSASCGPV